jgi:hypothetical protein
LQFFADFSHSATSSGSAGRCGTAQFVESSALRRGKVIAGGILLNVSYQEAVSKNAIGRDKHVVEGAAARAAAALRKAACKSGKMRATAPFIMNSLQRYRRADASKSQVYKQHHILAMLAP